MLSLLCRATNENGLSLPFPKIATDPESTRQSDVPRPRLTNPDLTSIWVFFSAIQNTSLGGHKFAREELIWSVMNTLRLTLVEKKLLYRAFLLKHDKLVEECNAHVRNVANARANVMEKNQDAGSAQT